MKKMFNLQLFAGENNDLAARSYQLEFKKMLEAVFKKQSYFADFFGGGIEALDGVQNNEAAFYVKTSDIPVVIGEGYDKETELGKGSRFGDMKEVVYENTPVEYSWGWNWHEGIDRHTVNNDLSAAIADRTELQAQAKTQLFNVKHAAFISKSAAKEETLTAYTAEAVLTLFNNLSKYFKNIKAVGTKVAKVSPDLYNAIVDHPLTTSAKGYAANIDKNGVVEFKGFLIEKVPSAMFAEGECCYTYIAGVVKAFTGINTARPIESTDFDGVAFQGAGKAGEYILPDNKKAVAKVKITAA
jgi:hypothetical protein